MISNFSDEAQKILNNAKLEMQELKHPYVGTEHLLLAILKENNELSKNLSEYKLTYQVFKNKLIQIVGRGSKKSDFFLYTPLLKKVIENAIMDSKENNNNIVTINHLFSSLLELGDGIAIRIILSLNIDLEEIYDKFTEKIFKSQKKDTHLLIEELAIDLNQEAKRNKLDPLIGREKEIENIEEILCRKNKNNPLLIGEPGVGKTAIVEGLAKLINEKTVPENLKNKRILSLDMASAVAGTKYRGEFEEKIKKIIQEIENDENIILFIDEIHTIIGAGGAEGAIDAANILKPALARGKIKCIGATTKDEYKKHFEKDRALERRFQIVNIKEPTNIETKNILLKLSPIYEKYHNVIINENIIDKIISLSNKYIYNKFSPDKEIDILDEVCSKLNIQSKNNMNLQLQLNKIYNQKEKYIKDKNIKKAYEYKIKEDKIINKMKTESKPIKISEKDITDIISYKTNIPIFELKENNKEIIDDIEKKLKEKIIGQDEAIRKLINITKRIKLGYKEDKCISLLFTGPSGVGKTKLATLFGNLISNVSPIKLDMTEYSTSSSISKFLGSTPGYIGYDDNNYILNKIKENPNAVIVLDEIDKAHPKIINLLYQILEDSVIMDARNNIINFKNNIIIMTTNKRMKYDNIGFTSNSNKINEEIIDTFSIPLLNRIDNIINFNILKEDNIKKIIINKLENLNNKYKKIKINIAKEVINEIIIASNYKDYGARKIDKIITDKIENLILDNIINDKTTLNIDSILIK